MGTNLRDLSGHDDRLDRRPSCALDHVARGEQLLRYRQLAGAVARLDRTADRLIVSFDEHLDRGLLERTLAVERECCPFFTFSLDPRARRLHVGVTDAEATPALDAIARALTG